MDGPNNPSLYPFPEDADLRNALSVLMEGVMILQGDRILYANPALGSLLEKKPDELVGSSFLERISRDDREKVRASLLASSPLDLEFHPEGASERLLIMNLSVIPLRGGRATFGLVSDVTERRKKRKEVDRLHNRLRSIIDSMRHVVISFSYDEEADQIQKRDSAFYDRYLVEINPAAEALYGVPRGDFLTKKRSIFDFVHEQDRRLVISHYNSLYEEGFGELTYRVHGPNREVRWVLDYGRVEYLEGGKVRRVNHILEDITKEKKALDELRASEEKYRRIFEKSKDMIYVLKPDGTFIDINPAGIELLGLESREEAGTRNMKEFHVDLKVREALVQEIIEKGSVTRNRVALKNTRGERIEADLNVIGRRDENGKIVSYQGIVHNITEALRQKELEAIGQLAGCFADDLASPLTVALMGIDTAMTLLTEIRQATYPDPAPVEGGDSADADPLLSKFEDAAYFLNEAVKACRDMKSRLEEIRDRYWDLKKVSDGAGGLIFQRETKAG
jgi:PAS domain S-box-containing protein